jgi:hypothetical protein
MFTFKHGYARAAWSAVALAFLVLVLVSGAFGRAQPGGNYRPELPPAALENGCWPLPEGVRLDFAFQVRTDGEIAGPQGPRRRIVLQYDLIDAATARSRIHDAFRAASYAGDVRVDVSALTGVASDSIVRGTAVIELPSTPRQSDSPVCAEPFSTKRFAAGAEGPR